MSDFSLFWLLAGICEALLFWALTALGILFLRQRRWGALLPDLALLLGCYCTIQFISIHSNRLPGIPYSPRTLALAESFVSLPRGLHILLFAASAAAAALLFRSVLRYERSRITRMSVKEAADRLPTGLCFYLPGGRVLMINRAMERFCAAAAGGPVLSGEALRERLFSGALLPGCERLRIGDAPLVLLPDATAWSVTEKELPYERDKVHMLLVTEVTELYRKTASLRELREQLSGLNERLAAYNREIVAATAEKELLNARTRLHDEMGADLLTMTRYLREGGGEEERAAIEERLRRDVSFLKTGRSDPGRDEYDMILDAAERLGVTVRVRGTLPQTQPQKHVLATAIHECFTNTIRHARGDELRLLITRSGDALTAVFTNNGEPPAAPIRETGGLAALRALTESAGGSMTVALDPAFSITLTLPKEVPHGLQSIDR